MNPAESPRAGGTPAEAAKGALRTLAVLTGASAVLAEDGSNPPGPLAPLKSPAKSVVWESVGESAGSTTSGVRPSPLQRPALPDGGGVRSQLRPAPVLLPSGSCSPRSPRSVLGSPQSGTASPRTPISTGGGWARRRASPAEDPASNWRVVLGLDDGGRDSAIVVQSMSARGPSISSVGSSVRSAPAPSASAQSSAREACSSRGGGAVGGLGLGSIEVTWRRPLHLAPLAEHRHGDDSLPPVLAAREGWQRAEWRLGQFTEDRSGNADLEYHGMPIIKGQYMNSPTFKVLGEEGYIRFWPNGFYNKTQIPRIFHDAQSNRGGDRKSCWCAIALIMPPGTHLRMRFFVGASRSDAREVYWNGPAMQQQLWMVDDKRPEDLSEVVVGVEVLKNFRQLLPREATPREGHRDKVAGPPPPSTLARAVAEVMAAAAPARRVGGARAPKGGDSAVADAFRRMHDAGLKLPSPRFGV